MNNRLLIVLFLLPLIGCSTWNRGMSYFNYKNGLISLPNDKRVLVEDGNVQNAQIISSKMDSSIAVVEQFFQTPFSDPVFVTICSTEKSYIKRCGAYKNTEAMTNWSRVFIAPLAFQKNRKTPVLVHELAHLHICQKIGIFKMIGNIPPWFNEGLAVEVSQGAGADEYTDSAAVDWMNHGKCIAPNVKGDFFNPSNNSPLPWDMFYRQSSLFVEFLKETKPAQFQLFLSDLENKADFNSAFVRNFGKTISDEFALFKGTIKSKGI